MQILEQVQHQLEIIYGIGVPERAENYLIDKKEALSFLQGGQPIKIPKELLLVRQPESDTVEVALFLDQKLLKNLSKYNPFVSLTEKNLSDFCILIEGVSHFVYFLWKAYRQHPITQLELELQAEIDKFLMLFFFLRGGEADRFPQSLFEKLFEDFKLFEELSSENRERYLTASSLAMRYCHRLQQSFSQTQTTEELIEEIRRFYNFSQAEKIHHITH